MNLKYLSKYDESKRSRLAKDKADDMKLFAKKEINSLTQKHIELPIIIMKL